MAFGVRILSLETIQLTFIVRYVVWETRSIVVIDVKNIDNY